MGGPINILIRWENGETTSFEAWTNPMPYWFSNLKLIENTEAHLKEYVEARERFVPVSKGPEGYGLVVIDVMTKQILNMQGYTSFASIYGTGCQIEIPYDTPKNTKFDQLVFSEGSYILRLKQFFDAGRVSELKRWDSNKECHINESLESYFGKKVTFDDIYNKISERDNGFHVDFILNMDPWVISSFSENSGSKDFKQRLVDMNFVFTESDDKLWDNWEKRYGEEEYDDEEEDDNEAT